MSFQHVLPLKLRIYGPFSSAWADGAELQVRSAKLRALLVLIAMSPELRRTRVWLQDMLWGRADPDHGRASLRRALTELRQCLGCRVDAVLIITQTEVKLIGSAVHVVGTPSDGALLEGIDIDEEGFEAWLRRQRQESRMNSIALGSTPRPQASEQIKPIVAILPFFMLSGDDAQRLLGDLVAEEATRQLSRTPLIDVIAHLSCRSFAGRELGIADIADRLKADYCVIGSYRVLGGRIVIAADLIAVCTGKMCWTRTFSCTVNALIAGDEDMIVEMVNCVRREVIANEAAQAATRPLPDVRTHALLIAGVSLMHRTTQSSFIRARGYMEEAIRRAPRHPELHAWLGKWYVLRVSQGWSTDVCADAQTGADCVNTALDLNPDCAFSLAIDGLVHNNLLKRPDDAADRFTRALEIDPNNALSWLLQGTLHAFADNGEAAVEESDRALALSPLDPHLYYFECLAGTCRLSAGDYGGALHLAEKSLRTNRRHASTHRVRTIALHGLGRMGEACKAAQELLRIEPTLTVDHYLRTHPAAAFRTGREWARALGECGVPHR